MKRNKRPKEPMKVELIPIYIPKEDFEEKKEIVQNLIAKILIGAQLEEQQKERTLVRLPPPSDLTNG